MKKHRDVSHLVIRSIVLTFIYTGLACRAASLQGVTPSSEDMERLTPGSTEQVTISSELATLATSPIDTSTATSSRLARSATTYPMPEVEQKPPTTTASPTPILLMTTGPSPTFPPLAQDAWCIPWNEPAVQANVIEVIDGVTIEVLLDGKPQQVAYAGLGLLEYAEDWTIWQQMTDANRRLVEGKTVTLIGGGPGSPEAETRLRYALAEGVFVNLELIRSGYAVAASTPPETNCDALFLSAQMEATANRVGLWAPQATPTRTLRPPTPVVSNSGAVGIVKVANIGTFWQEPDEFVEIYNSGVQAVQLEGWSVRNSENFAFIFPEFILGPGQYCRVTTNLYQPQHCGFTFGRQSPVWDNMSDCATLQDSSGRQVDEYCY